MFYNVPVESSGMGMTSMNRIYSSEQLSSMSSTALAFESLPNFTVFPGDSFSEQPSMHVSPCQQTINIDQILIEFNHARRMLFRFDAYGVVSRVTYIVSRIIFVLEGLRLTATPCTSWSSKIQLVLWPKQPGR